MMKKWIALPLVLLTLMLQACGGGSSATPQKDPEPLIPTYDLNMAMKDFYSQSHTWDLKGTTTDVAIPIAAKFSNAPIPSNGTFIFGGHTLSMTDVVLEMKFDINNMTPTTQNEVKNIGYEASTGMPYYQTVKLNGVDDNTQEIIQPIALPTAAKIGDKGSFGTATAYIVTADKSTQVSDINYAWELNLADARPTFCVTSTANKVPASLKTVTTRCHEITEKNVFGSHLSISVFSYINGGTTLVSGYTIQTP